MSQGAGSALQAARAAARRVAAAWPPPGAAAGAGPAAGPAGGAGAAARAAGRGAARGAAPQAGGPAGSSAARPHPTNVPVARPGLLQQRQAPAQQQPAWPRLPAAAGRAAAAPAGLRPFAAGPLLARARAPAGAGAAARRAFGAAAAAAPPPGTLAGAAEAAAAGGGWTALMSWAGEGMWAAQAAILNALNLAGSHLPMALGLLLADWLNDSPLLRGALGEAEAHPWEAVAVGGGGAHGAGSACAPAAAPPAVAAVAAASAAPPAWRRAAGAAASGAAAAWRCAAFGARLLWLAALFAPVLLTAPLALQWGWRRADWMALLRATLEAAGPAWVKWGQWSATRHDLFPPDMCAALEVLHASAPGHAYRHTEGAIGRAFGLPAGELFEWLEEAPLASGSIGQVRGRGFWGFGGGLAERRDRRKADGGGPCAPPMCRSFRPPARPPAARRPQIHRARLSRKGAMLTGCAPGSLVAVKVRHPHVSDAIERDFQAMMWLAAAASALFPALRGLRLEDTLKQFEAPLHEQVRGAGGAGWGWDFLQGSANDRGAGWR
jgi:aarF domain-containing kinase